MPDDPFTPAELEACEAALQAAFDAGTPQEQAAAVLDAVAPLIAARVRAETAEGIAQAIEAMDLDLGKPLTRSGAAAIARAHRTTPTEEPS